MPNRKKPYDLIRRGERKPTPAGTLTFIGLRAADIPFQHALLTPTASGLGVRLLTSLGVRTIFTHTPTSTSLPSSLLLPINALLSPAAARSSPRTASSWTTPLTTLTPTGALLVLMSVGSFAKQAYWQTCLSRESFPPSVAATVSVCNTLLNSAGALLFLALGTTSLRSRPRIALPFSFPSSSSSDPADSTLTLPLSTVVGVLLYVAGMAIETVSERRRLAFKNRPGNEDRVCMEGMWRWARHVNYFGYVLWRAGYCMVGGGWLGGVAMGLWEGWDLGHRAVAVQDEYCSARYGEQWARFKREVPYRIVPGIY